MNGFCLLKMKLTNSTKIYRQNVSQDMIRLGEPPLTQWAIMKAKLQEKYIPSSYKSQLFSNVINLKQITLSVANILLNLRKLGLGVVSSMPRINLMSALILLMVLGSKFKG